MYVYIYIYMYIYIYIYMYVCRTFQGLVPDRTRHSWFCQRLRGKEVTTADYVLVLVLVLV